MSAAETTAPAPQPGALALPEGWIPLAPPEADPGEWVEAYLDGLREQPSAIVRAQLRYTLLTMMEFTTTMRPGKRYSFALVEDPAQGAVRGLLTMQMMRTPKSQIDNYRDRLRESNQDEATEVLNREVFDIEFPAGHGVVLHDYTVAAEIEALPDPALERTIIGLFLTGPDVLIEFAMYAQDLLAFDNMPQYLVDIVSALDTTGAAA